MDRKKRAERGSTSGKIDLEAMLKEIEGDDIKGKKSLSQDDIQDLLKRSASSKKDKKTKSS